MTPYLSAGGTARLGAIAVAVVVIAATVLHVGHGDRKSAAPSSRAGAEVDDDPLQAELKRCQLLAETGANDDRCLRAWAETRRRFLRLPAPPALPSPQVVAKPLLPANASANGAPADRPAQKSE